MGCQVDLPWPARELSPNFRAATHWPRTRALRRARKDAFYATMAAKSCAPIAAGAVPVRLVFHPPTAARRDHDNLIASMKPALDGVAQALGVDDARFRLTIEIAPPAPPGKVVVAIG